MWTPRRVAAGVAAGLVAGALVVLAVFSGGWKIDSPSERVLLGGIQSIVLTALVLIAFHALDVGRRASTTKEPLESPTHPVGH